MSDTKKLTSSNESMKSVSVGDSMRSTTASQRSNTPNTTQPVKTKPVFTPPPQNVNKNSEK